MDRCKALTRRDLGIAAAASMLVRPACALDTAPSGAIACRVMRAGHDIGRAIYTFSPGADSLNVNITVDIRVKFGFLTMFRYTHSNAEQWQGSRLAGFDAHTNNNGQIQFAAARQTADGLAVIGSGTRPYTAPATALGTSYWNPRTLTDPLINSQTGKLLNVSLAPIGESRAIRATGAPVPATEYRMSGDLRMNLWYDSARRLAGLQYYAHDGSVLTYEEI